MIPKLPFSRKNNQQKSHPSEQPSVNSTKPETKSKQSIITRIGQLLLFWTNNQNKSHQSEQPSVNSTESEKKNTILSWLMEFGQKSLLIAIVTASGSVIVTFITNPDKVQLWLTILFPKPVSFSCEGITVQIPQNWQQLGCQSVAIPNVPDATIIPKSFVSNESNSPKIRLIVEELYDNDVTLQKFYQKRAMTAIDNKNNTYFIGNKKFQFKGNSANYELVYDADNIKRRDIGFLYSKKQYTIRYEASTQDFDKYEKEAKEIINSLELDSVKEAK
ncbi:MAG: hypothetical protein GPI90_00865 [Microcystis aeruginosa K13-05]|jgi:hypothetical protein|uniref:hypothetical protein n=1 Tax=unclassified Microcystis TaxID=2643300 RepID=UPI0022CAD2B8|nr:MULTISPECIES: hypothetical protein [unclassified Microcystis]MCZ8046124.1 hypothetical protein [Microcystis sp. LE19-41.2A]MCZ8287461.1 hypothetical protein [Microcystis sp. LE19-59.1C]NCR78552.1 hypothetical protein [Microcystis aeruginosa K13-10]NCR83279.1 hypothetical protein [Microcystis aeruginosa K13-05]